MPSTRVEIKYSLPSSERQISKTTLVNVKHSKDTPTPKDFDTFLPWICREMQCPLIVVVKKANQEEYVHAQKRLSTMKMKSKIKNKSESPILVESRKCLSFAPAVEKNKPTMNILEYLQLTTYYNSQGHLVEITFANNHFPIPRKVIKAINLCVPFHTLLTKLVIRKSGLNSYTLHELGKLLVHSRITDVCLDNTYVPEGNYYLLLQEATHLKYLSLSRCSINDKVCKEIFSRLSFGCPAEKNLMALDVSSNRITDLGAQYIGQMLRTNRHLLHLNLSGNEISDVGAELILIHLKEFPLIYEEIIQMKFRKKEYLEKKFQVYQKCMEDLVKSRHKESVVSIKEKCYSKVSAKGNKKRKGSGHSIQAPQTLTFEESTADLAQAMTQEILGELEDPFKPDAIVVKNDYIYCTGNMTLCSINMAYNNLGFLTVMKLCEVTKYQREISKPDRCSGLLRVQLDGNNIQPYCIELVILESNLRNAIAEGTPLAPQCPKKKSANHQGNSSKRGGIDFSASVVSYQMYHTE